MIHFLDGFGDREMSAKNLLEVLIEARDKLALFPADPIANRMFSSGFVTIEGKTWFNSFLHVISNLKEMTCGLATSHSALSHELGRMQLLTSRFIKVI